MYLRPILNIWGYNLIRYNSTFYITTPIFYANAAPHLGHLYTAVLADAAYRFQQLNQADEKSIFSTGTDEHGLKIQKAALSNNIDVDVYCNQISEQYRRLFDLCDIKYTNFVRTTDQDHFNAVKHFWNVLKNAGYIYGGEYSGWYCISDETFISENQLTTIPGENGEKINVSSESGHPVEWTKEENYMFKLSSFKSDLLYWLNDEKRVVPYKFYKMLRDWVSSEEHTCDISVSRPAKRISWGIPVPDDENQTVYVWLDALVNYLTVVKYPNTSTWPPSVHICGKDILKFHGIFWPAFLIAAGLEPPKQLFVHSHWTVNYEKMSKSKNNVIDPFKKIQEYSVSGVRYFLLKDGVPHSDGNYSETKIINLVNAELANTLGNLLNRCCAKSLNPKQIYPVFNRSDYNVQVRGSDSLTTLAGRLSSLSTEVGNHYSDFNYYKGIEEIIQTLHLTNKYFEDSKPWELKKINDINAINCIIHITMESLRICGIALSPIIPHMSEALLNKLNISKENRKWNNMNPSWEGCGETSVQTLILRPHNEVLYKKIVNKD